MARAGGENGVYSHYRPCTPLRATTLRLAPLDPPVVEVTTALQATVIRSEIDGIHTKKRRKRKAR